MWRLLAATSVHDWWPKLTDINFSEGQSSAGVPGDDEQVELQANVLHQTGHWLILLDYSNTFNSARRAQILRDIAVRDSGLATLTARCHGGRSPTYFLSSTRASGFVSSG